MQIVWCHAQRHAAWQWPYSFGIQPRSMGVSMTQTLASCDMTEVGDSILVLWPINHCRAAMIRPRLLLPPATDAAQEDGSGKVIAFEAQEVEFPAGDEGYETQEAVERLQVRFAAAHDAPTHKASAVTCLLPAGSLESLKYVYSTADLASWCGRQTEHRSMLHEAGNQMPYQPETCQRGVPPAEE